MPSGTIDVLTDYDEDGWPEKWENDIVPGWNERSTVPAQVEYPRGPQWPARLRTLVEEGRPPEVYHCQLSEVADLVASGATRAVGSLVDDFEASNGKLVSGQSIRADGAVHLVPHGLLLGSVLCYRTDLYTELDLAVPETWDELLANARAIDGAERFDERGFAVAAGDTQSDAKAGADLRTLLANAGGGVWRWADRDRRTVELDFNPEAVRPALELLRTLGQYSPDPARLGYAETMLEWLRGNVGQCLFPNAWLAGEAYRTGRERLASNTAVALPPLRDRSVDPIDRGWAMVDGTAVFRDAESTDEAEEFLRFLYEGPARQAAMNLVRPMQYLPPYEDVLTSDTYRNADYFEALDGHLYELNRQLVDEVGPHLDGNRPHTIETWGVRRDPILSEMVRSVLVDGASIEPAIEDAQSRLTARLEEGRQRRSS